MSHFIASFAPPQPAFGLHKGRLFGDLGRPPQNEGFPMELQLEHEAATREITIPVGRRHLGGHLTVPHGAAGVVLFAHGSGSGRFSPRNRFVAAHLNETGLATMLIDLLEEAEAADRANVFDIDLLAERLYAAAAWLELQPETENLKLGLFGASTGAAAALTMAAKYAPSVAAVVSRGGRPDLAAAHFDEVEAPTLLIVGGDDDGVIELNQQAYTRLRCPKQLAVIPGATHLFEEPGALEEVVRLARDWFNRYLPPR
jgi:putative phosphoribosyl transferase